MSVDNRRYLFTVSLLKNGELLALVESLNEELVELQKLNKRLKTDNNQTIRSDMDGHVMHLGIIANLLTKLHTEYSRDLHAEDK